MCSSRTGLWAHDPLFVLAARIDDTKFNSLDLPTKVARGMEEGTSKARILLPMEEEIKLPEKVDSELSRSVPPIVPVYAEIVTPIERSPLSYDFANGVRILTE